MKGYRQVNNYTFENDLLLLSCQLKCSYNKNCMRMPTVVCVFCRTHNREQNFLYIVKTSNVRHFIAV